MKKFLLSFATVAMCLASVAQEKVEEPKKAKLVEDAYARNSISIITIQRGDTDDYKVNKAVKAIDFGDKFDNNTINTTKIDLELTRDSIASKAKMNSAVMGNGIGKEVVQFYLNNVEEIERRGRYNADDQRVDEAKSSKIGATGLSDDGFALLANSYVVALDFSKITKQVSDDKKSTTWTVSVAASVYNVDVQLGELDITGTQKLIPQAYATALGTATEDNGGFNTAVSNAYYSALLKLEKAIDKWKVTSPVYKVKPITSKIGTKEGLKNTARYAIYRRKSDFNTETGETYNERSVKTGYVRASKVVNNSIYAQGANSGKEMPTSEFYQISGVRNAAEGDILKQANDLAMGVSPYYSIGGLSDFGITIDKMISINTKGTAQYAILDFGYKMMMKDDFKDPDNREDGELSYLSFAIGYGYGIKLGRFIEALPNVAIGGDYYQFTDNLGQEESDETFAKKMAYFGRVGAKFNFQVAYPLQLVAGVDYSLVVSEGDYYQYINSNYLDKKRGGIALTMGVKWIF